jgi:hypothetical protein
MYVLEIIVMYIRINKTAIGITTKYHGASYLSPNQLILHDDMAKTEKIKNNDKNNFFIIPPPFLNLSYHKREA